MLRNSDGAFSGRSEGVYCFLNSEHIIGQTGAPGRLIPQHFCIIFAAFVGTWHGGDSAGRESRQVPDTYISLSTLYLESNKARITMVHNNTPSLNIECPIGT